jgi:serralysin
MTGAAQTSLSAAAAVAQQMFDAQAGVHEVAAMQVGTDTYIFYSGLGGTAVDSAVNLGAIDPSLIGAADFVF